MLLRFFFIAQTHIHGPCCSGIPFNPFSFRGFRSKDIAERRPDVDNCIVFALQKNFKKLVLAFKLLPFRIKTFGN